MKRLTAILLIALMLIPFLPAEAVNSDGEFNTAELQLIENGSGYISIKKPETGTSASKRNPRKAANLPASFDARNEGYVTPVRNQRTTNTCWAHSTVACLESYVLSHNMADDPADVDFSEAHIAWYTMTAVENSADEHYGENWVDDPFYGNGGNGSMVAPHLALGMGIAEETSYPLFNQQGSVISSSAFGYGGRYCRGSGFVMKDCVELENQADVKQWIYENGAVSASIYADNYSYQNADSYYTNYNADQNGNPLGTNHAITLIGWDDNYSASNFPYTPDTDGAVLVKDSWGTNTHGGDGLYWISYCDLMLSDFLGFTCESAENKYRVYSHTAAIPLYLYGYSGSFSVANVYKAKGNDILDSVSFNSYQGNLQVDVSIYRLSSATSQPKSGTLVSTGSATINYAGWNKIDLNTEYEMPANTYYSVVLDLKSTVGAPIYVYVENQSQSPYSNLTYTSAANQSYYCSQYKGTNFSDFKNKNGYGNIYINVNAKCKHNFVETSVVPATCLQGGETVSTCINCGKTQSVATPPAGHSYELTQSVASTCSALGYDVYTCPLCSGSYTQTYTEFDLTNHSALTVQPAVQPDCTHNGHTEGSYCADCGAVISEALVIPATGHTPQWITDTEPDCTHYGSEHCECAVCNASLSAQLPLSPTPHNYGAWSGWVERADGTKSRSAVCADCGFVKTQTEQQYEEVLASRNIIYLIIYRLCKAINLWLRNPVF